MNEEEDKHMKIWKKNEEQQDIVLDEITANLKNLNRKAKNINEIQDIIYTAASQPHRKRSRERTAAVRSWQKTRQDRVEMAQDPHCQPDGEGQSANRG